jgi:hypothetical protein
MLEELSVFLVRHRCLLAVTSYVHAQSVLGFCTVSSLSFKVFETLLSIACFHVQRNLSLIFVYFESPVINQHSPYSLCILK